MPAELAGRWNWSAGNTRRQIAEEKRLFYAEQHGQLVKSCIERLIEDTESRVLVVKFVSRSNNLVRTLLEAVAVAYSRGVRREVRGLGEKAAKAFAAIVRESGINRLGNSLNAMSWLMGPHLVGPCVVDGKLCLDVIMPTQSEVRRTSPESLAAAVWRVGNDWVELDSEAWRYYGAANEGENPRLYKTEPHAAGRCPLAIFRCDSYLGFPDWWASTEHAGLVDASKLLAYKHAFGLWTRQNGSTDLTVINDDLADIPPGQTISHPSLPLVLRGGQPGMPVAVFKRTVNPAEYLLEMSTIVEGAVTRYGIPPSEVTFANNNSNWGALSIAVRGGQLDKLRDKQVPWLLEGERQLWVSAADVLRGSTHRLARELPPGDEMAEALLISFPDLAPPDEQSKAIKALQLGLGLGLDSPTRYMMARRPELTLEEAQAERLENINDYAAGFEIITARNIPTGDAGQGVQTIAQQQGREGGRISGESRREEEAA